MRGALTVYEGYPDLGVFVVIFPRLETVDPFGAQAQE